jgi:hypothetical protein
MYSHQLEQFWSSQADGHRGRHMTAVFSPPFIPPILPSRVLKCVSDKLCSHIQKRRYQREHIRQNDSRSTMSRAGRHVYRVVSGGYMRGSEKKQTWKSWKWFHCSFGVLLNMFVGSKDPSTVWIGCYDAKKWYWRSADLQEAKHHVKVVFVECRFVWSGVAPTADV